MRRELPISRFHPRGAILKPQLPNLRSLRQEEFGLADEVRRRVNEVQARRPSCGFHGFLLEEPNPRARVGQRVRTVFSLPDTAHGLEPTGDLLGPHCGERAHSLPQGRVGTSSSPESGSRLSGPAFNFRRARIRFAFIIVMRLEEVHPWKSRG